MEIRCRPWAEAGPELATAWRSLRLSNPALRSPFLTWEFVDAVAARHPDVEVAVWVDAGRIVGCLPFQRRAAREAVPVGTPMNDCQAIIAEDPFAFDPVELLEECSLDRFEFDHMLVVQGAWAPYHTEVESSPVLDLSSGFDHWVAGRRQAGRSRFERLKELRRALARAVGPVRFESQVQDVSVLEELLVMKSAQYRRTLGTAHDLFADPAKAAVIRDLFRTRSPELSGTLCALWAGEHLVAAHFGLRAGETLHWWFPVYAPSHARFSPGALLLLDLAQAAPREGTRLIDFGKGDETYKRRWATGSVAVATGRVDLAEVTHLRAYLDQELEDARLRRSLVALQQEAARLRSLEGADELRTVQHDLHALRSSWSWRVTRPVRAVADALRRRSAAPRTATPQGAEPADVTLARARAEVEAVRRSMSWRLAGPLRVAARLLGVAGRSR